VLEELGSQAGEVLVLDAACLQESTYTLGIDELQVVVPDGRFLTIIAPLKGWIRRLAPPDWQAGVVLGSRDAAMKASWLGLLASLIRVLPVSWLTDLDAAFRTENKLLQTMTAHRLGIPVPESIITSAWEIARERLGETVVLKPLGPSHYLSDEGKPRVVFAQRATTDSFAVADLRTVPFIAQREIVASKHLRVVTVGSRSWVASLVASEEELDWRRSDEAHGMFSVDTAWAHVSEAALRLACALGIGFSSQDWIVENGVPYFLDLNPGGQWLFLPPPIPREVARAIGDWLTLL